MTQSDLSVDSVDQQIAALEAHLSRADYDEKELAEAERTLRKAFRTTVQGSESTSAFFAGMYRTENKAFKDGKMPEYFHDPKYPDEVRDRWATQVHAKESARPHFSKPPGDQQDYLYASVHAVVNSLPEQYLVFIKAQFLPAGEARGRFLARLLDMFWRAYQPKIPAGINGAVLHVFAQTIVASSGAKEKFLLDMVKAKIDMKKANWHRHYAPHWCGMKGEFAELRKLSLSAFLAEG